MNNLRKAFIMLSAAITMNALGLGPAEARSEKSKSPPEKGKAEPEAKRKAKKPVVQVRKARRRPADFDPDLSMPAGTAYDVIASRDLD